MANSPNPKGLPMHKALAMGLNPKVNSAPKATGANNFTPKVTTGATAPIPTASAPSSKMPGTMPSAPQFKLPKGAK